MACSAGGRHDLVHAYACASHPPNDGHRARKPACRSSPAAQQDEKRRARHLHTAMHRPHNHTLGAVSALTSIDITLRYALTCRRRRGGTGGTLRTVVHSGGRGGCGGGLYLHFHRCGGVLHGGGVASDGLRVWGLCGRVPQRQRSRKAATRAQTPKTKTSKQNHHESHHMNSRGKLIKG